MAECGLCGLTYIGHAAKRPTGKLDYYYRCNGKHGMRGLFEAQGKRCPSKDVNGTYLDNLIWGHIEQFLRDPGEVLKELRSKLSGIGTPSGRPRTESTKAALAGKSLEREKVVALYRRRLIDESVRDQHLGDIEKEEGVPRQRIEAVQYGERQREQDGRTFETTQALLATLRERLDQPVSERQFVNVLVAGIQIHIVLVDGKKQVVVNVSHRFASSAETCTGTRAGFDC